MDEITALVTSCPGWLDMNEGELNPDFGDRLREGWLASGLALPDFLCVVAKSTAHEYAARRITYVQGDGVANWLWNAALAWPEQVEGGVVIPEYLDEVYSAFDAGEYPRKDDSPEVDLAEKYTRPHIEEIVARDNAA